MVVTPAAPDPKAFIQQRRRWAGKWKYLGNRMSIVLALFIFFIHLGILTGMILTLMGKLPVLIFVCLFLVKVFMEYRLIHDIFTFAEKKFYSMAFMVCAFGYSLYAVVFGLTANIGKYTWKGRRYKI